MHLALLLLYFIVIDFLTQIKFLPFSNRNGIYQLQQLRFFAQNINLFTKNTALPVLLTLVNRLQLNK